MRTRSAFSARATPSLARRGSSALMRWMWLLERVDDRVGHVTGLELLHPPGVLDAGAELGLDHERQDVAELDGRALDVQLAADGIGQADHGVLGGRVRRAAGG